MESKKETNAKGKSKSQAENDCLHWSDILLTPLEDSDIDLLYLWQNSPGLRDLTMGFRFPVQKDTVRDWIKNTREQNSKASVVFAIRYKHMLIGTTSLHHIDHFQRKASFGICIGDNKTRHRGSGFIATCLMLDYAFNGLDFRRIGLEVIATNARAISLYERMGFRKEGNKRQDYYVNGKYIDTYIYGMLKEEFNNPIPSAANRLVHAF